MNQRVIIMAGGDGTRWNDYLGGPKHFIPVGGEILLERTINQVKALNSLSDIIIIGPPEHDPRYVFEGTKLLKSTRRGPAAIYELFSPQNMPYNPDGRTVMLFGDVWYSDRAMATIVQGDDQPDNYTWFGRSVGNDICAYGELWAISFRPEAAQEIRGHLEYMLQLHKDGTIKRAGGWETYRLLRGIDMGTHEISGAWVEINELTEDFDFPEEFDKWLKKYEHLHS